ncbi:ATP-dependent RNA helicase DbpA [Enterovibrio norvegicus FF-33]|uniref:DEAD-box ATP-dependent RNA helicase RhpA n=1 Tax=Enterovibrio norvegicus FF-454 TaxID=1185651 RepID=A0A1E5C0U3_9GAMM|nr:ATP-dependent RNA helicase DbpA [Enterovibrio norvegicus]OEE59061.1 ATP-dependent RNA helicase DbpA [Enterovibrio norvegicus FF-454]OEE67781.1 ATP-dependent RNA helicase DbpA [Enterovibrio norvegicus FF-33]OEE74763.1 ATP-dependent RNA helicase DbpA [Enterovibrio norvegicus FF-162]
MTTQSFSNLPLKAELLSTLTDIGYTEMTPIQAQSLPAILEGKDVIGQGKTGSGKTAAFGLGLLNRLNVKRFRVQSLVLCPTRELADQVAIELRKLARGIHNIKILTLCGGVPMGPQIGSLEHGAHIIVGTPGRILDHLDKGRLSLEEVNTLVLDEADRMLEMGFQPALDAIFQDVPSNRQTLLFSATFPTQIQSISRQIMNAPVMVKVESNHDSSSISQHFYQCNSNKDRMHALQLLLLKHQPESAVVFCNTKREVKDVAAVLDNEGFSVVALHGDLEQRDRDQMLLKFANKSVTVMVATDVAARGLDIEALDAVINYDMAFDTEIHIHRIGRTGRAGSEGAAYTFFNHEDGYKIALLEDYLKHDIKGEALPDDSAMTNMPRTPIMTTLHIEAGKKNKVRPGDIVGALTGENGIEGSEVGKIKVTDYRSYVAVKRDVAKRALDKLSSGKIKGRTYRVWQLR